MSLCNTTFDLKINLGHSDLYFMVQWFLFFAVFACQSMIQASYAVLRQLLLRYRYFLYLYSTIKCSNNRRIIKEIGIPEISAVIIIKFEKCNDLFQYCFQKMQKEW